ncbi:MAG: hypothetical protein DLM70_12855 [Chloroflexi bacterium]|nr:MAG: hypothetical protein DLM70_12855 [Chloroflexota bacterium]
MGEGDDPFQPCTSRKDILLDYPEERERWFQFKDARFLDRAREWLADEEIEPI